MALESPSKGGLIAVTTILFALQLIAVIARFVVRKREKVKPWVDDYLALAACVFFFAFYFVTVLIGVTEGSIGQHIVIGPQGPVMPNYTTFVIQYIFVGFHTWVIGAARLSIIYLYRRIFVGRSMRVITTILAILTTIWIVGFFITFSVANAIHCYPGGKVVTSLNDPGPFCIDTQAAAQALGITGVLFDFIILVLPWPWIWKLHMRRSQKWGVTFIFLLGNLTLSASIVRCYFLFWSFDKFAHGDLDFTYFDGINLVWTQTEAATAIICSCLPNFGRVILKSLPSWRASVPIYLRSLFKNSLSRSSTQVDEVRSEKAVSDRGSSSANSHARLTGSHPEGEIERKGKCADSNAERDEPTMLITREVEFGYERV